MNDEERAAVLALLVRVLGKPVPVEESDGYYHWECAVCDGRHGRCKPETCELARVIDVFSRTSFPAGGGRIRA